MEIKFDEFVYPAFFRELLIMARKSISELYSIFGTYSVVIFFMRGLIICYDLENAALIFFL